MTLTAHADRLGLPLSTLRSRVKLHGLESPLVFQAGRVGSRRVVDPWGNELCLSAHSRLHDIPVATLHRRLSQLPAGDPRVWAGSKYEHGVSSVDDARGVRMDEVVEPDEDAGAALRDWARECGFGSYLE